MSEVLRRQGGIPFYNYVQSALQQARAKLNRIPKDTILANDVNALVDNIMAEYELEPVEEDPSRQLKANPKYELYNANDFYAGTVEKEITYAVIEIPLIPRKSNKTLLQLQASTSWPVPMRREEITYRDADHTIIAKVYADDAGETLKRLV